MRADGRTDPHGLPFSGGRQATIKKNKKTGNFERKIARDRNKNMKLKGKIVLITGASSGIGAATALGFAREGARLLLAARRAGKVAEVASACLAAGAEAVHSVVLDVRDRLAVGRVIDGLPEEWAAIEILVNNAGLSRGLDKLYTGRNDDWEDMIETNVKGLLHVTRAVVPGMVVRNQGHVINLGSTAGEMTYPNGAVYCATKAAVIALNDGLRQDVLGSNVRVSLVDPGTAETEFALVRFRGDEKRASKVYQGFTPLAPEDVAEAIVWTAARPAHVNIARITLTSIDQANSILFNKQQG